MTVNMKKKLQPLPSLFTSNINGQHVSPGSTAWELSLSTQFFTALRQQPNILFQLLLPLTVATCSLHSKLELAKFVKENIIIEFK